MKFLLDNKIHTVNVSMLSLSIDNFWRYNTEIYIADGVEIG